MNVRACLGVVAIGCLALASPFGAAAEKRPNVVLVLIDDQGYGDLSCTGNPVLKTPNMDALAADGVRLNDFHVCPLCSPTRSSLMTGRYCRKVGVQGTNHTAQHMATDAVTMADLFSANGYATGMFGKWHLGDRYPLRPMDRGFAESVFFPDGAVSTIPDYWGNRYFDDTYLHNGKPQRYKGYCTDTWFDLALRFIETNKDRPFFCYLPTNAAHAPYLVPERYAAPYENDPRVSEAHFYGMIASLDENLGRLRKRLVELGLDKNTILIFMGDNGSAAGVRFAQNAPRRNESQIAAGPNAGARGKKREFGGDDFHVAAGFNAGMRGKKGSPYDGGHRVACFIHYPAAGVAGGRQIDQLSAHVDILPTLVEMCGLECKPARPSFDGISLKHWLTGANRGVEDRVVIESFLRVVMTKRWRLVGGRELYDIQKDPGQQHNVASQFPEVVAQLSQALDEYRKTEDLRPHRIVIGSDRQNPVTLTGEDCKAAPYQNSVSGLWKYDASAVWNVDVAQAGRYRLALRRWPRETDAPINAALPQNMWCHGMSRCVTLHAVEAGFRAGDVELKQPVADSTQEAEFTVDLPAGNMTLQGWFVDKDKQKWLACYLYAQLLKGTKP